MNDKVWSHDKKSFEYDTLGELMDSHDDLVVGDIVYSGTPVKPDVSKYVCIDRLLEQTGDSAYDHVGDCIDGWPYLKKKEQILLEEMIVKFIEKHCPVKFYTVIDIEEYTITLEDTNE